MNEKPEVILLVGVPATGKSWASDQLGEHFEHVPHDSYIGAPADAYVNAIAERAKTAKKPVLCEAPFSVSQTRAPLEAKGFRVTPVFLEEKEDVLRSRWKERGMSEASTIQGHLSRQRTYRARAIELNAYIGTSTEVLTYLTTQAKLRASAQKKRKQK